MRLSLFDSSRRYLLACAAPAAFLLAVMLPRMGFAQNPPPAVGPNVNMVANTTLGDGDPFLTKQNEPSMAVSSLNPMHLLGGANDYRLVDFSSTLYTDETADAWVSIFKSIDGGATWKSTVLPGCPLNIPQCNDPHGASIKGLQFASDPTVRPGPYGSFFYSFIAGNRGTGASSIVGVTRIFDRNDNVTVNQDPFQLDVYNIIDTGTPGQDKDKPWVAADVPGRSWNGANTCTIPSYPAGHQTQPAFNVYVAYSNFTGQDPSNPHPSIYVATSTNCGQSFAKPIKVSQSTATNQGGILAVDPVSGAVYIAWRQFFTAANGSPDAIYIVKSTDGGNTFSKPMLVAYINPFDQGTSFTSFRTNDFPALTVSVDSGGKSWVNVAWSQRGIGPNGDARIVLATSPDGVTWSGSYTPIDNSAPNPAYNPANPNGWGHQFMPTLAFAGGKLTAAWYDQREDQTIGQLVCPANVTCKSTRDLVEVRQPYPGGNLDPSSAQYNPAAVFTPYITDGTPGLFRRHTLDVFVAMAVPGPTPAFASSRASKYFFGSPSTPGAVSHKPIVQLRFNAANLPIFANFTAPFLGDYIDIAAAQFIATGNPKSPYQFNSSASNRTPFHLTWADNRDVIPPKDGNWSNNTPIQVLVTNPDGTQSVVTNPACAPGQEGSKNQNVYTAVFGDGLGAFATENSKLLNATTPRGFVVVVQNITSTNQTYQLVIAPSAGTTASFIQNPALYPNLPNPLMQISVTVPARSTVSRIVWVTSPNPGAAVTVNIFDATGTMLQTSVVLNGDPLSNLVTNASLNNDDLTNDDLTNDDLTNDDLTNDDLTNDDLTNDDLTNAAITNDDLTNLGIPNDDLTNHEIANDDLTNNTFINDDLTNGAMVDANFTTTNNGNTDVSLNVKMLLQNQQVPPGFKLQLVVHKVYATPMPQSCKYVQQGQNVQVVNVPIPNASPVDPNLTIADVANGDAANPTLPLMAGEKAKITLRIVDSAASGGTVAGATGFGSNGVKFVAVGPSSNGTPVPLIISTLALPNGMYGALYSSTLQYVGGTAPVTWTVNGLPPGLTASGATISGTPTAAGTFTDNVSAVDSSSPQQSDIQTLTLTINPAPLTVTANNQTMAYGAGSLPPLTVGYSGFVKGDSATSLTTPPTCSTTATANSPVGTYPITCTGAAATNYSISYVAGTLTITSVALTITANNQTMTYGGPLPALTVSYSGFVNGDTAASLTMQNTCTTTATSSSPVGSYPINCSGAVDANYTISYLNVTGTLTVTPAKLTITASSTTVQYGGAVPAISPIYSGLANGDTAPAKPPTCSTTYTNGNPVSGSPYPTSCSGAADANYTISYVVGALTVTQATPVFSALSSPTISEGTASVTLSGVISLNGLYPTGSVSITLNGITQAAAISGTSGAFSSTFATGSLTAGSYAITYSYPGDKNFAAAAGNGTLTVTNVPPSVAATSASVTVAEGSPAANTGTYFDPVDTVTLTASVGTIMKTGANTGNWTWSLLTSDGPAQSQTVTITANDGKGGITQTSFTLVVLNVAPTATFNAPSTTAPGGFINVSLTQPSDPSPVDTAAGFTYAFDCGLGAGFGAFTSINNTTCAAGASGSQTVQGKVQDKDGGISTYSATLTIKAESFTLTSGSMLTARSFHTATLLPSGLVLIAGGFDNTGKALASAEVFNLNTQTFSATANAMPNKAAGHTATLLPNGLVLITGGGNSNAQLYNPATNTFSSTGGMGSNRSYHTATPLPNGLVLIAGGSGNSGAAVATALLYNPATGSFSSTGSMATARERHTATLLPNGMVLITGGRNGSTAIASGELYNPATGTFSSAGSMSAARYFHKAELLTSGTNAGKVLIEGGSNGTSDVSSAELYDPASGKFSLAASLVTGAREAHRATVLGDGRVLVSGGANSGSPLNSAELYSAAGAAFLATGSLNQARFAHTATLLSNGSVLVTGGVGAGGVSIATAEIYNSGQ